MPIIGSKNAYKNAYIGSKKAKIMLSFSSYVLNHGSDIQQTIHMVIACHKGKKINHKDKPLSFEIGNTYSIVGLYNGPQCTIQCTSGTLKLQL